MSAVTLRHVSRRGAAGAAQNQNSAAEGRGARGVSTNETASGAGGRAGGRKGRGAPPRTLEPSARPVGAAVRAARPIRDAGARGGVDLVAEHTNKAREHTLKEEDGAGGRRVRTLRGDGGRSAVRAGPSADTGG